MGRRKEKRVFKMERHIHKCIVDVSVQTCLQLTLEEYYEQEMKK